MDEKITDETFWAIITRLKNKYAAASDRYDQAESDDEYDKCWNNGVSYGMDKATLYLYEAIQAYAPTHARQFDQH
ncbi:MAG: hypothetical protein PUK59_04645 [Actinomycetaceae bacterium]|nr:hypothetical protein [Actinomycetaceae bacterium]